MKKYAFLKTVALLIVSGTILNSCSKIDWEGYIHPDKTPKLCAIKQIKSFREYALDTLLWTFNYNNKGNPTYVQLSSLSTYRPEFIFLYDKNHRLSDHIESYGNNIFENWHKYVYEGNRIVRDTVYGFGKIVNGKPVVDVIYVPMTKIVYFQYDHYDRITKATTTYPYSPWGTPTDVEEYTYNHGGNLQRYYWYRQSGENTGTVEDTVYSNYDNKVNIHRTHKIWMFMDRNYSMNNSVVGPTEYNNYGLPVKQRAQPSLLNTYRFLHPGRDISDADIQYNCK